MPHDDGKFVDAKSLEIGHLAAFSPVLANLPLK